MKSATSSCGTPLQPAPSLPPPSGTGKEVVALTADMAALTTGGGSNILEQIANEKERNELIRLLAGVTAPPKEKKPHNFWKTQPVPKSSSLPGAKEQPINLDESGNNALTTAPHDVDLPEGPIEVKTVAEVQSTPYPLPAGFVWCDVDLKDDTAANDVYTLLTENYVEDDDNMFRFDYSIPFLKWALLVPG
jgi:hypothetical protein